MAETGVQHVRADDVDPARGLTTSQVAERVARGQVNDVPAAPTRTVAQIVRANIFTRFNAILGAMLAIILVVGPIQDALFGFVLIANAADRHRAGAAREADPRSADRAHRAEGPRRARRRGAWSSPSDRSCWTTSWTLARGSQIVVDGEVLRDDGLEIDESLLTGESDPVDEARRATRCCPARSSAAGVGSLSRHAGRRATPTR